ncbi:hypothetical protein BCR36DRAFT_417121 [Piromyces finnis]|uniref:Uncharacterized protein n=1 Tax=Piromyces finnis TaxID=1754191 RepID=A0A1Y1UG04_9FUNG|nr:hypothetical protein BCR36DRAFT_417121 [Piromyces finnis]|eukprot:ORX36983.1 hypothetical protein BCR36DRAFT_417121 [Piromyces finnis]
MSFENQSNVVKDVNNLVNNNSIENQGLNVIGVKNKKNSIMNMKKKMQFPKKDKNISNIKRDNICDKTINKRNDSSNSIQSKIDEESSDKCDLLEESQRNKEKAFINRFNDNESDSSSIVGDDEFIDITTLSSRSRKKSDKVIEENVLAIKNVNNILEKNLNDENNDFNNNKSSSDSRRSSYPCNMINQLPYYGSNKDFENESIETETNKLLFKNNNEHINKELNNNIRTKNLCFINKPVNKNKVRVIRNKYKNGKFMRNDEKKKKQ